MKYTFLYSFIDILEIYEATDNLYNIFEEIFANENELEEFLKRYGK